MPDISNVGPTNYSGTKTPTNYVCSECGASGVRLFREYQTFLNHSSLNCTDCALKRYKKGHDGKDYDFEGRDITFEIGWMVAAIPSEEGKTFWGYSAVPTDGVEWWKRLPAKL